MFFQISAHSYSFHFLVVRLCSVGAVAFYTPFWLVHLWSGSPLGSAWTAFYVVESGGLMLLPGML